MLLFYIYLGESVELKALLQNPHLREFLRKIDSAENPAGYVEFFKAYSLYLFYLSSMFLWQQNGSETPTFK
jgi:hypothetical protein